MLLVQLVRRAASRAACTAGSNRATSTPMMAITTSNSTSVKPREKRRFAVRVLDIAPAPKKPIQEKNLLKTANWQLPPSTGDSGNSCAASQIEVTIFNLARRSATASGASLRGHFVD